MDQARHFEVEVVLFNEVCVVETLRKVGVQERLEDVEARDEVGVVGSVQLVVNHEMAREEQRNPDLFLRCIAEGDHYPIYQSSDHALGIL
jgi:hypothetical protein